MLREKLSEFYDGAILFVWSSTRASCFMFFGYETRGRLRLRVFVEQFTFSVIFIRQNRKFLPYCTFLNNRYISWQIHIIVIIFYNQTFNRKKYS